MPDPLRQWLEASYSPGHNNRKHNEGVGSSLGDQACTHHLLLARQMLCPKRIDPSWAPVFQIGTIQKTPFVNCGGVFRTHEQGHKWQGIFLHQCTKFIISLNGRIELPRKEQHIENLHPPGICYRSICLITLTVETSKREIHRHLPHGLILADAWGIQQKGVSRKQVFHIEEVIAQILQGFHENKVPRV